MLTAVIAFGIMLQNGQATQDEPQGSKAGSLISKMLKFYYDANTLKGTIKETQFAANKSVTVTTEMQFDRPGSKLYFRQVKESQSETLQSLITSDGRYFSYDPPFEVVGNPNGRTRLVEQVSPNGTKLKLEEVWAAGSANLLDKSFPQKIAIAKSEELKFEKGCMLNLVYQGTQKLGDETVHEITGSWRQTPSAEPTAIFQILMTDDGQLRKYSRKENLVTRLPSGQSITYEITTVWDVNLTRNGEVDQKLFTVVR